MTQKLLFGLTALSLALPLTACAPKIYVIDRPTLMEEESGGEWPDVQKNLSSKLLKKSPSALNTTESSKRQKELTRTLEPDESPITKE